MKEGRKMWITWVRIDTGCCAVGAWLLENKLMNNSAEIKCKHKSNTQTYCCKGIPKLHPTNVNIPWWSIKSRKFFLHGKVIFPESIVFHSLIHFILKFFLKLDFFCFNLFLESFLNKLKVFFRPRNLLFLFNKSETKDERWSIFSNSFWSKVRQKYHH